MPDLPKVTPDMMGTLKTLGQICSFLLSEAGPQATRIAAAAADEFPAAVPGTVAADSHDGEIHPALIEIVSRLTGYPVEMLGLDMDIEADLGIDSIKRVEILSAMEERLPGLVEEGLNKLYVQQKPDVPALSTAVRGELLGSHLIQVIVAPAEFQHAVADFADHVVTAHQGGLVVTWL